MSKWILIQLSVALNPKDLYIYYKLDELHRRILLLKRSRQFRYLRLIRQFLSIVCGLFFFFRRPFFVCALEKFNKKSNGKYIVQHLIHTKIKCFSHLCCYLRNICHWQQLHIFYILYERNGFHLPSVDIWLSTYTEYGLLLSEFSPKWNDIRQS